MSRSKWPEVDKALESARDNILTVVAQATAEEYTEGLQWYAQAGEWIADLSSETGLDYETVADVFAALSPANKIDRNLQDAENVCQAATAEDARRAFEQVSCGTYHRNKRKAWAILRGREELTGQKVSAFAQNLKGDWDTVTVDRHAFNVAIGDVAIINKRGPQITPKRYRLAARGYSEAAEELGIAPAQVQAIAWVVWKRIVGR